MDRPIEKLIDIERFLSRHDMVWTKKPHAWYEGPFIGSGLVGSMLYYNSKNKLILTLGDTSVYDDRPQTAEEREPLYLSPRLPLGHFILGGVTRLCEMRLDLYDAVLTGKCRTLSGNYSFSCWSPHGKKTVVFDFFDSDIPEFTIEWEPAEAVSPRQKYMMKLNKSKASPGYQPAKNAYSYQHREDTFCIQPLFGKGCSVVAYRIVRTERGSRLIVVTGQGSEESIVTSQLSFELQNAQLNHDSMRARHERFWHSFYNKSFLSVSDAATEEFYWLQLYKLASAGCEEGRIYDTCGPWLPEMTAWPGTWWDLNVQLTYSPLFTSNHTELVRPLATELRDGISELAENVPQQYRYDSAAIGRYTTSSLRSPVSVPGDKNARQECGNLLWALHSLWQCYQITQDRDLLSSTVFPLLKRAVGFYAHFLLLDKEGVLHIPQTISPEYPKMGIDANYDLALLKWGVGALLDVCDTLELNESAYEEWKWIAQHLADYPVRPGYGFQIAADVPFSIPHRHYSHLLMVSPLRTIDAKDPAWEQTVRDSLDRWHVKPDALQGYSYTGAASMYALLGDGDKAYERLSKLWENGFITPNTMYQEGGNPVLETPCAAAAAILDMLLQSKNGSIAIFPAIPKVWTDISFSDLACEGGFQASGVMRNGQFLWASVKNVSSRGGVCEIRIPTAKSRKIVLCTSSFEKPLDRTEKGIRLRIPKGQTVVFKADGIESCVLEPTTYSEENCHVYGLNKDSMI